MELKARSKEIEKDKKAERKASKLAINARRPQCEVARCIDFDGDMQASQVEQLREEFQPS